MSLMLDVPADFISLQEDVRDEDLAVIERWRARNPAAMLQLTGADLNDFADSAALAANLDLIIMVDTSAVYPREIVKAALAHNAAAVFLAYNHPSGRVEPSKADIDITKILKCALALVGTIVMDHLIIGGSAIT